MRKSSLRSLLGVVSSLSPSKMLFAPAKKHSACATRLDQGQGQVHETTGS